MINLKSAIVLVISLISTSYAQIAHIDGDIEEFKLESYTEIYTTKNDSLELVQIQPADWRKSKKGTSFGMVTEIFWIKYDFYISSKDSLKLYFYTPYHHIRSFEIYFAANNDTVLIADYGTTKYFSKKEIKTSGYSKSILFPPGKSSLFLKIKHLNIPLRANSYLLSKPRLEFIIKTNDTNFKVWRIIVLFAFFIALITYLITRIKIFFYYLLLNIGVILFIGMEIGEFFLLFDVDTYFTIIDIKHLGDLFVLIVFPLFLNELTPIKRLSPKIWRLIMNLTYLGFILWAVGLVPAIKDTILFYYIVWYLIIQTCIVFFAQLYFLFITLIKKEKNSIILFILYLVYIFAVLIEVILPNIGYKSDNIFVYNILLKSSIIEVVVFLILMGNEMLNVLKDRNDLLLEQKELQKEMVKTVVSSQEKERNALGRELHDKIGANMTVIKQYLDESDSHLTKIMEETIETIRSLSHGLMTPKVNKEELKDEIIDLCLLCSSDKLEVNYYFHNWKPLTNKENSTHLYRIIQELLQNTIKHSNANEVYIQFIGSDKKMNVVYDDNGVGYDINKEHKKGKGILGINFRVDILQGNIQFYSSKKGTSVQINFAY